MFANTTKLYTHGIGFVSLTGYFSYKMYNSKTNIKDRNIQDRDSWIFCMLR